MVEWYPQGKTSVESRFNIPGAIGWATMESVGFITLLYIMVALPRELSIGALPMGNWTMAGCFVRFLPFLSFLFFAMAVADGGQGKRGHANRYAR